MCKGFEDVIFLELCDMALTQAFESCKLKCEIGYFFVISHYEAFLLSIEPSISFFLSFSTLRKTSCRIKSEAFIWLINLNLIDVHQCDIF